MLLLFHGFCAGQGRFGRHPVPVAFDVRCAPAVGARNRYFVLFTGTAYCQGCAMRNLSKEEILD